MSDIETIKDRNRIEEVIEESGYDLGSKRGRYMRGQSDQYNSLVVNVADQYYMWNSKDEGGDVITWLQIREGWDFKTSVEHLAKRAKLDPPSWSQETNQTRLATRAKEDGLTVAARWFVKTFRKSKAAQKYAAGRGWNEDTARAAGIGFTGSGSAKEKKDLEGDFAMYGVDLNGGAAKAAMGIPAGFLVFPHVINGRVRYLSARSIEGKSHYNLPVKLVGPRQLYFNHVYHGRSRELTIMEGQSDAITFAQWGIPAIAMAGVTFKDHKEFLIDLKNRHELIYVGIDNDEAGMAALIGSDQDWPMAEIFGPMARVVRWAT